ncbi:MAG: recombinase family protein [Candidatus Eisenbacteria bacterium]
MVKLIFRLFVEDLLSMRGIAKELTRRGIAHYNKHIRAEAGRNGDRGTYKRAKNTSTRLRPRGEWVRIDLPDELRIIDGQTFDKTQRQLAVKPVP